MVFGFFKSQRQKFKEEGERMFDNYISALKGCAAAEIGATLDMASRIKYATTIYGSKTDELLLFEDPLRVPEDVAFDTLKMWKRYMFEISNTVEGMAKVGALSIWYLSLLAGQIGELRIRGREMWKELERGFPYCSSFDPEKDCVAGLEGNFE